MDGFDLSGRVAIVTGGSSGLGAATARALAGQGATVAVVARRRERLDALVDEIGGLAVEADLLVDADLDGIVPAVRSALGPPEILVSAAGGIEGGHLAEAESPDAIRQALELNLVAPFRLAQSVQPSMVEVGRGSIVFVSSISGHVGVPGIPQASYAASKLGLTGLTRELAVQWAGRSIRVNTVAPGFFRSEITESLYDDPKGAEWLRRNTPLPYEGSADDIVGTIQLLASDAGRGTTGQTLVIDNGWTAR
jgi:hypothetical protein